MNLWFAYYRASEHNDDLLREAKQDSHVRQALAGRPKNPNAWCKALGWLGLRLTAWGIELQERYGTATSVTTLVERHSD